MSRSNMDDYFHEVEKFFQNKEVEEITTCPICNNTLNKEFSFYRTCDKCDLQVQVYQPTQKVLDEFYKDSKSVIKWANLKTSKREEQRQSEKFQLFWSFIKDNKIKSVLDVGCGNGFFLNRAFGGALKFGIEMSDTAKSVCNFPVYESYEHLKESIHKNNVFDFITMCGVLEHLKNPKEELKKYIDLLEEDGAIGVIVPNRDSLIVDVLGTMASTYCPQHLWYFNIVSLSKMFAEFGFVPIAYTTIEPELQPILKELKGIPPYKNIGIRLTDQDITEESIIANAKGYKIIAIFIKESQYEACCDNSSQIR